MDRKERLLEAFEHLRNIGEIHTQKDLAERMNATPQNVSRALKGIDSVLTDNFLRRFNHAFGDIFQDDWLISGDGQMLKEATAGSISNVHHFANSILSTGQNANNIIGTQTPSSEVAIEQYKAPIVPETITKKPDLDVLEYVQNSMSRVEKARIILDETISLWYRVEDNALAPRITRGDLVALQSDRLGMCKIIPDRVYAVDCKSTGISLRKIEEQDGGLLAIATNPDYKNFSIEADDVIRIYRVICMASFNV